MDPDLKESMFRYYDERAAEYEEIYLLGKGPASISGSSASRIYSPLKAGRPTRETPVHIKANQSKARGVTIVSNEPGTSTQEFRSDLATV